MKANGDNIGTAGVKFKEADERRSIARATDIDGNAVAVVQTNTREWNCG